MQEKQTKYSPTGEKPQVLIFSQGEFVVRSYTIALKSLATRDPFGPHPAWAWSGPFDTFDGDNPDLQIFANRCKSAAQY